MPTFEEARRLILDHSKTLGTESVELVDSLGLVTAEGIVAPWEMPLCDNSAMDGFAVRAADCTGAARLRVVGFVAAGGASSVKKLRPRSRNVRSDYWWPPTLRAK